MASLKTRTVPKPSTRPRQDTRPYWLRGSSWQTPFWQVLRRSARPFRSLMKADRSSW